MRTSHFWHGRQAQVSNSDASLMALALAAPSRHSPGGISTGAGSLRNTRSSAGSATRSPFPKRPFNKRVAHGTESLEVLQRRAQRALQLSSTLGEA